jgi:hypothetical protein
MTSLALVQAIVRIARQARPDEDVTGRVFAYLHDHGIWFSRHIEDASGLTVEVPLKRGRARRQVSQAALPFEVENEDQSVIGSR